MSKASRLRVVHVVGARPNFMKIAPLMRAFGAVPALESILLHTGQHYDERMSRTFFDELGIPEPDVNLEVAGGSHAVQTARILERFEAFLLERTPGLVVVVGDVNSTAACSLAAAKLSIPVAHVEAGLRSFDRTMPEEINRVVTDALSELLFVSEPSGVENLAREGIAGDRVHLVGNVMIDTLLQHRERAAASTVLADLRLRERGYAVLTLHRPANVDEPERLVAILGPILEVAETMPVVFPVHPRTRATIEGAGLKLPNGLRLVEPMGYLDFLRVMSDARLALTDSGGVQEETTVLGVPCVTLRDNTERPVTITHGTNRLGGTSPETIRAAIGEALAAPPRHGVPPLWDGRAAERIAEVVRRWSA